MNPTTRKSCQRAVTVAAIGIAAAFFVYASLLPVRGGERDTPPGSVRIDDVAWIAGHWLTEQHGDQLEETWSEPSGDCMMGMFRWMKNGKVWMYELLTIREEADGLVFRFRHFSNQMHAWEEKDWPLTFTLVHLDDNAAVFENPQQDHPRRYTFERRGDDALAVRIQGFKDGRLTEGDVFVNRRK